MKLHNNKPNRVLVNMSQQLAYNEDMVSRSKNEVVSKSEVTTYEMTEIALYMSNRYLNERNHPNIDDTYGEELADPIHTNDQIAYFSENAEDVIKQYYEDKLPPIHFKDDNLSEFMTVGDIRLSQYPDETPIIHMDEGEDLSSDTPYRQPIYGCTRNFPSEIYLNQGDLNILKDMKENDNIYVGCAKKEDSTFKIKGITF